MLLEDRDNYVDGQDHVAAFLAENCTTAESESVRAKDLYASFRDYYLENVDRHNVPGPRTFGERVKRKLDHKRGKGGITYTGIKLKAVPLNL